MTPDILARYSRIVDIYGSMQGACDTLGISRQLLKYRVSKANYPQYLSLVLHAPISVIESADYSSSPLPNEEAIKSIVEQHMEVFRACSGYSKTTQFESFAAANPDSPIVAWVETQTLDKLHAKSQIATRKEHRTARHLLGHEKADSSRFPLSPCGHCDATAWSVGTTVTNGRIVAYFAICSNCKRRCGAPNRYWPLNPAFAKEHSTDFVRTIHGRRQCKFSGCQNHADDRHHYAPRGVFGTEADSYGTVDLCKFHHARWHRTMNDWKRTSMIDGLVYALRTWTMDGGSSIVSIHTTMREAQDAVAALMSQHTAQTVEIQEVPVLAISRATAMKETAQ